MSQCGMSLAEPWRSEAHFLEFRLVALKTVL